MYYFLGYLLEPKDADNTFILALDGDVDFQPLAVRLLVDLMKRDQDVGAACGRIHPIGSGSDLVLKSRVGVVAAMKERHLLTSCMSQ